MSLLAESARLPQVEAPRSQPLGLDAHAIRRILVCVDRSPSADVCLRQAVAIADGLGSAITLLHVMEPPQEPSGVQTTDVVAWEISRQEASAYLEHLKQDGTRGSGRKVETRLEEGHPAERIAAVARALDVDLTVLGSHGDRGPTAWNLGSNALQVLAVARGSVLVAHANSRAQRDAPLRRILVPLDGSLRTESVLPTAVRIANTHGAELLLVLLVREPVPTAVLHAPEDLEAARALAGRLETNGKRYLDRLLDQLAREGARVRTVVLRSADETQSLLDLSEREACDLVVLSAHGSTCNPAVTFGSVAAHLLRHAVVSLLVLQDLSGSELRERPSDQRAPALRARFPAGS